MRWLWDREPALVVAFVEEVLLLLMVFGVPLTVEQFGAIQAVIIAAAGLVTRRNVYAPATIQKQIEFEADDDLFN